MVEEVTEAARTIGVPSGDPLCVVSVAWKGPSLASRLPAGGDRDQGIWADHRDQHPRTKTLIGYIREAVVFALSATGPAEKEGRGSLLKHPVAAEKLTLWKFAEISSR